jgi:hypothetical protein
MFATRGPSQAGMLALAAEMRARGPGLAGGPGDVIERDLTLPVAATPDLDPIVAIQAFYVMAAQLSARAGDGTGRGISTRSQKRAKSAVHACAWRASSMKARR